MTKREYAQEIAKRIGGEVKEVDKANGVVYTGIYMPKPNGSISPTVYIDKMYENDVTINDAIEEVKSMMAKNNGVAFDVESLKDFEKVKPLLRARLYNRATKADVFRSARHYGFNDLIIIPYIENVVPLEDAMGSVKVTQQLLTAWGVTMRQVIDTAIKNSKRDVVIKTMRQVFMEMAGIPDDMIDMMLPSDGPDMYVITNKNKMFGASAVLFAKEQIKEIFPNGYAILPSSVHEVLAVPLTDDSRDYDEMIQDVNAGQVAPEEQLGDKAYLF